MDGVAAERMDARSNRAGKNNARSDSFSGKLPADYPLFGCVNGVSCARCANTISLLRNSLCIDKLGTD
jgi:hypothetical protein